MGIRSEPWSKEKDKGRTGEWKKKPSGTGKTRRFTKNRRKDE